MASVAEQRRARFNAEFARMLGDKIGTTRANYTDASMAPAFKNSFDLRRSTSGGSSGDDSKLSKTEEVDAAVREKMLLKLAKTGGNDGGDESVLGSIWGGAVEGFKRTVDMVSRPGFAVAEAMRNTQQAVNEGEPLWSLGDDFVWGAGQGAGGFRKTGFGDVVEEATNYSSKDKGMWNKIAAGAWFGMDSPGETIGKMEQTNPEIAKWTKRTLGLAGDVGLDPLTYLSLGTTTAAKTGLKAVAKVGAREAGEALAEQTAKQSLKQAIKRGTVKTGLDAVNETIERSVRSAVKDTALGAQKVRTVVPETKMFGPTISAVDDVVDDVTKQADKLFYEVSGGAQKGKRIGGEEATRTISQLTAEGYRNRRLLPLDRNTKRFIDGMEGTKSKLSTKQLETLKEDPIFKIFHEKYVDEMSSAGSSSMKAAQKAREAAASAMEKETTEVFARVHGTLADDIVNIPTLRVLGQNIAYFPRLGKTVNRTGKALANTPLDRMSKAFSWTSNFPGYSSLIAQKARALGAQEFKLFQQKVFKLAQGTSKADRKLLQEALEDGLTLTGELEAKRLAIREMYDELFLHEVSQGLRTGVRENMIDDYAYLYVRGPKKLRDPFLNERAQAVIDGTFKNFGSKEARRRGLKPVNDAFENLLHRKLKSNRQLTRQFFARDLATHYGIKGSISAGEAKRRGLRMLSDKDIPDDIAKTLKPGEKLYLDQDIAHVMDNYKELTDIGAEAAQEFTRQIDYITRKFKVWNTVYYPAFHIRNMIGDIYMGALDGVKTRDYTKVMNAWMKKNTSTLDVAGNTLPFNRVKKLFDENAAAGGFNSAEVGGKATRTTEGVLGTLKNPRSYGAGVRAFSEHREDFGRFVHFYHALNDELPAAMRRHGGNLDKALATATNAATFRVNKYKFDYGALTKFEQKVMRRGMPFYTYMRKAIPTLAEAVLMSPRNLSYTNKVFNSMFPENSENFDTLTLPSYIEEQMFAVFPGQQGSSEPTGITGNFLPQNVFNDMGTNPLSSLNPLIKGPLELKFGKDIFTGEKVENLGDILENNIRAFKTWERLNNPDLSGPEKAGTITGLPIVKISEQKQASALENIKYQIKGNIRELNKEAEQYGYHIFFSQSAAGPKIKVRNYDAETQSNGSIVGEFDSFEEAVAAMREMYGK